MEQFSKIEQLKNLVTNPKGTFFYIHSFMGNFQMKKSFANYFANYNFYAINLPGHGNTPLENEQQIKVSYCANLVKSYIETLDLKNLILFGHSLGGGIVAILNSLIPERIKLNIFEAPACGAMLENMPIIHKLVPKKITDTIEIFNYLYYDPKQVFGNKLNLLINLEFNRCNKNFLIFNQNFNPEPLHENITLFDTGFQNIKVPSLIILGEKDGILPTEIVLRHLMKINNNNLQFNIVPHSAHAIYSEQPKQFIQLVEQFLKQNNA